MAEGFYRLKSHRPASRRARLFDDASTQYLERDIAVLTTAPLTMACWGRIDDATLNQVLMSLADLSTGTNFFVLMAAGNISGDPCRFNVRSSPANVQVDTGNSYSVNTWQHFCGVETSSTNHVSILNGDLANKGFLNASSTPSGIDRTSIGRAGDSSPGSYTSGRIALPAIWNVALNDSDVRDLAAGAWPEDIRRENLIFFPPLDWETKDRDIIRGLKLTAVNGPTWAPGPPNIKKRRYIWVPVGVAAAGQTVEIGLNTETDLAQTFSKAKSKSVGLITESDLAQSLVSLKSRILSLLTETDIAQAIGKTKSRAVGLVSEADLAQAIGKAKALAISIITETDIVQPLGKAKSKAIALINETDQVFAISTGGLSANLGLQTEADLALALGKAKIKLIGLASELDVAQPMSIVKRFNLGLVLEVDSVFVMSVAKARALGLVSESDVVFPITSPSSVVVINLVQRDARFQAKLRRDGTFTQTAPRDAKF